jgi:Prophage CP4-57 regulatory protein (AlpA)
MGVLAARSTKSAPAKKSRLLSTMAPAPQHQQDGESAAESAEQQPTKSSAPKLAPSRSATAAPRPVSLHYRQGDRGSSDDAAPRLPTHVCFHDLRVAGIVSNWPQLYNFIDDYGFPQGVMLSPNCRAWNAEEVRAWLDARPV